AGRANWPKMEQAIARIKAARAAGQQVGADIYPYVNNGLGITALVHPRHSAAGRDDLLRKLADPDTRAGIRREIETEGGWENWYRHVGSDWDRVVLVQIKARAYAGHNGQSLAAIARASGKDPWDVFFEIAHAGAASALTLHDRGRIAPGAAADLVVFDVDRTRDRSTFAEPGRTAEGVVHVLVNGRPVIESGKPTAERPGRVLRRAGHRR